MKRALLRERDGLRADGADSQSETRRGAAHAEIAPFPLLRHGARQARQARRLEGLAGGKGEGTAAPCLPGHRALNVQRRAPNKLAAAHTRQAKQAASSTHRVALRGEPFRTRLVKPRPRAEGHRRGQARVDDAPRRGDSSVCTPEVRVSP